MSQQQFGDVIEFIKSEYYENYEILDVKQGNFLDIHYCLLGHNIKVKDNKEVKNALESEKVIIEDNSVSSIETEDTSSESSTETTTTSTNTTTSNTNSSSSSNTNSSTSGSTSDNSNNTTNSSSSSSSSTPTTTETTTQATTNSNNSSNSTSTPSNNTTNTSTSEDELSKKLDELFKDAPVTGTGTGVQIADFELSGVQVMQKDKHFCLSFFIFKK